MGFEIYIILLYSLRIFWKLQLWAGSNVVQGRKWLLKSGGASSNTSNNAAPSILPKSGGAIAPLPPFTYAPVVHYNYRGVVPRGAMAPSDFVRSVSSISTREGRLCPPNNTGASGFSDLPTALNLKRDSSPQDFLYPKILPRSKELSIPRSLKEVRKFGRSVRLRRSREIKEVRNFRG